MNKVFIVYQKYQGREAVCCYFDEIYENFSWAMFADHNNTENLFDRLYELQRANYKIEFRIKRKDFEEDED